MSSDSIIKLPCNKFRGLTPPTREQQAKSLCNDRNFFIRYEMEVNGRTYKDALARYKAVMRGIRK